MGSETVSDYFRDKNESWALSMNFKSFQERCIRQPGRVLPCFMFLLILAVGLIAYDDYGIPYDDVQERRTTLVNLKYILRSAAPSLSLPAELESAQDLLQWGDRYYGVAAQLPTAIIEYIFGFSFSWRRIFMLRHFWTFLQFFTALIFFFLILRRRFRSTFIAMAGVLFLWLSPRIFADAFYNIKDIPFLSWIIIASYFIFLRIETGSKSALGLFAFCSAIATNTRVVGGVLLLLGFAVLAVESIRKRRPVRSFLFDCMILFLVYGAGWILISPVAWSDPIGAMIQTLRYFSAHPHPLFELYFGAVLTSKPLPWHYLPVWIGITTPCLIVVSFVIGAGIFTRRLMLRRERESAFELLLMDGYAGALVVLPVLSAILLNSTLYNGWRHFYFVYPWIIYISAICMDWLLRTDRRMVRSAAAAIVVLGIGWLAGWNLRFHPYQYVYFGGLLSESQRGDFENDYWSVTGRRTLGKILASDSASRIVVSAIGVQLNPAILLFPEREAGRVYLADWSDDYSEKDYLVVGYSSKENNPSGKSRVFRSDFEFPAYERVDLFMVDRLPIVGIYRRITNQYLGVEKISAVSDGDMEAEAIPALTDWDRTTEWSCDETANAKKISLLIDLGELRLVSGVTLRTVIQRHGVPETVVISTSMDGREYQPVTLTDTSYAEFFFRSVEARYVRIEGAEAGTDWRLSEVQLWDGREAKQAEPDEGINAHK